MNTPHQRRNTIAWFVAGFVALGVMFVISLALGAVTISLGEVVTWLTGGSADDTIVSRVLAGVRLPRALTAVVIGAVLGVAGIALQGIHRTAVVDAHLVGLSSAAGLGAALGYALAPGNAGLVSAVVLAAVAGATFGFVSRQFVTGSSRSSVLVLVGIAAGFALTAWTGLFVLIVDSASVPTLSFFIFGSLAGSSWLGLALGVPIVGVCVVVLWWFGPGLDLLAIGEQESQHLGFNTQRRIPAALVAIGAGVGAAVALGGVIGFVGLIVPLSIRPMVGRTHRLTIPASAVMGAIALLIFDTAARTIASPVEIPIGLLTAAIGGPVLVWLVRKEVAS